MKKIITTIIATILLFNFCFSQDVIHLKSGVKINVKIVEVGIKEIKYKKYDLIDGPNYVLNKRELEYIRYENDKIFLFSLKKEVTVNECKAFYNSKINAYRRARAIGLITVGAGIIGSAILIANYRSLENPSTSNQNKIYSQGVELGLEFAVLGTVLTLITNRKVKQYSEKLKNISLGANLSSGQKEISLIYRF